MKQEKNQKHEDRMKQDVNETSRTMKPGKSVKQSNTTSQNSTTSPTASGGITNIRSGKDTEDKSDKKY